MTDKKSFADKVRDHATADSHHALPAPDRPSWAAAIIHRWPTWLAFALAALTVGGSTVESLADVLPMLAFFLLRSDCGQKAIRARKTDEPQEQNPAICGALVARSAGLEPATF
jgi:hypothetical protein